MSDVTRPSPDDPTAVERLREEVTRLRLQLEDEVRTRRVVVVDGTGAGRIRLTAETGAGCRVTLLDPDGFERLVLEGDTTHGGLRIAGRSDGDGPSRVDVFALDPEDDQGTYVGVELVDAGTSVAGFTVVESLDPRTWVVHP